MEYRNRLLVDFRIETADGSAERRTALEMLEDNVVKERADHRCRPQGLRHGGLRRGLGSM